jgi:hypothetical protein
MVTGAKILVFDLANNPDAMPVEIRREVYQAKIAYSEYSPRMVEYLCVSLPTQHNVAPLQLSYEFLLKNL